MEQLTKKTVVEKWITNPVNAFISKSTTGGFFLFFSALLAIFIANSSWAAAYHHFWEHKIAIGFDNVFYLDKSIHHWINDGLMAIFFFVVGLELKREILAGELSNPRKAILPIAAAFGGMLFPALIYIFFNKSGASHAGWGIPMATDIAFALGVLFLLGNKIPSSVKIFLTALAIADDLGAVLVIAICYTDHILVLNLLIGLLFLGVLFLANVAGVRSTLFYGIVGVGGVWLFFLMSGVHATIAAVLLAFTIPANAKVNENSYIENLKLFLEKFKNADQNNKATITNQQLHLLENIRQMTKQAVPPLQRLEHALHPFVTFVVMPVFAFANAGVTFSDNIANEATSSVAIGVVLGLLVGKFVGVVGVSSVLIGLKVANLPKKMTYRHLIGVGFLASIGFTMSLFVSNLAFSNPEFIIQSKIGIFAASLIGGVVGFLILNKKNAQNI